PPYAGGNAASRMGFNAFTTASTSLTVFDARLRQWRLASECHALSRVTIHRTGARNRELSMNTHMPNSKGNALPRVTPRDAQAGGSILPPARRATIAALSPRFKQLDIAPGLASPT